MRSLALAVATLVLSGTVVRAQDAKPDSVGMLERADTLVREGRADEARTLVTTWWARDRSGASRDDLQHAIWLRGVLTVDPRQAAVEYRRLVVEFPGGPFGDRAMARLAQGAAASGDSLQAAHMWQELLRERPRSPWVEEARGWLDSHPAAAAGRSEEPAAGGEAGKVDTAVVTPVADTAVVTEANEPAAATGAVDSAAATREARAVSEPGQAAAGDWAVQLGAFRTLSRATELMERARRAGFEPRLVRVPGSELMRVRTGRFTDEGAAREAYRRVVRLGFDALVVDNAAQERAAGG